MVLELSLKDGLPAHPFGVLIAQSGNVIATLVSRRDPGSGPHNVVPVGLPLTR